MTPEGTIQRLRVVQEKEEEQNDTSDDDEEGDNEKEVKMYTLDQI